MNLFSAYSGYYTVGGILYNGGWGGHILKNRKIVFISVLVSLMFVTILQPSGLWHNFTNPFCACISIFVFCLILRYKPGKHLGKLSTIFAKQTLGIYGLHIFFLKTIKTLWHPNAEIWIVQIVLYFILILALSFFMSKLLKVIPFLRDI